jgi:two-component system, OmpR family, response regulator
LKSGCLVSVLLKAIFLNPEKMPDKRVLIIDDETDFCLLIKNYLIKKNFEVFVSHTLKDGMDCLEKFKPDILFLDNNLPDGLGWEKTEYICAHYPQTSINLISAFQYNADAFRNNRSIKIWEKPISITDLNQYLN